MKTLTKPLLFWIALLFTLVVSHPLYAGNNKNELLQINNDLTPTTVENWQGQDFTGSFDANGSTDQVFGIYYFSLPELSTLSFSTDIGQTFTPIKLNLFDFNEFTDLSGISEPLDLSNLSAQDFTANALADTQYLNITGASADNLGDITLPNLNQLSLGNGITDFCVTLAQGDYFVSLSGNPKDYATYQLSSLNIQAGATECCTVSAVPEPSVYGLMLAGLGVMGWVARKRKVA